MADVTPSGEPGRQAKDSGRQAKSGGGSADPEGVPVAGGTVSADAEAAAAAAAVQAASDPLLVNPILDDPAALDREDMIVVPGAPSAIRPRGKRRAPAHKLDREYVRQVLDVALRVGSLMISSQAGTADVSATMVGITAAYGVRAVQSDVTATTIILSVPRGVEGAPLTSMFHIVGRSLDYTRLNETLELAQEIADERPELADAHRRIDRIWNNPHPYPRWVSTLALGVMASAFSVLLGAGPLVALIALATTAVIDRVGRFLSRFGIPLLFLQAVAGFIATTVTISLDAANALPKGSVPSLIVASNIMALLSGMAMVSSVQDAITGYHLTSVGRLMEILISSVGIFLGVGASIRLGIAMNVDVAVTANVSASWLSTPTRVAAGMVGAAAFALASYAPWRAALAAGIAAIFGTLTYIAMMHTHGGNVASSFVAAAAIGFIGSMVAGRLRIPMLVVAMAGIVPLVPGFTLYKGFVNMVNGHQAQGLEFMVIAAGTALALAAGVVLGPLLAPAAQREMRRVRKLGKELGPRVDSRWMRTPALASISLSRKHYAGYLKKAVPRAHFQGRGGGPVPPSDDPPSDDPPSDDPPSDEPPDLTEQGKIPPSAASADPDQ